jgi:hypothetical protein
MAAEAAAAATEIVELVWVDLEAVVEEDWAILP